MVFKALTNIYLPKRPHPALTFRKMLVIEDDFGFAMDIKQAFEEAGSIVLGLVGREEDALALLQDERPISSIWYRLDGKALIERNRC